MFEPLVASPSTPLTDLYTLVGGKVIVSKKEGLEQYGSCTARFINLDGKHGHLNDGVVWLLNVTLQLQVCVHVVFSERD